MIVCYRFYLKYSVKSAFLINFFLPLLSYSLFPPFLFFSRNVSKDLIFTPQFCDFFVLFDHLETMSTSSVSSIHFPIFIYIHKVSRCYRFDAELCAYGLSWLIDRSLLASLWKILFFTLLILSNLEMKWLIFFFWLSGMFWFFFGFPILSRSWNVSPVMIQAQQ